MNNHLSEFQQLLLITFKYFHTLCEEHGITYYAHGGTLIGAVRHQGFIPWDNDMDVLMPRKDYEKFLSLQPQFEQQGYHVAHITDGQHLIWVPFAKFYGSQGTIWEQRKYRLVYAPWIDIFPMDNEDTTHPHQALNDKIAETLWSYRKCIARHPTREIWSNLCSEKWVNGALKIFKTIYYKPQLPYYYHRLRKLLQQAQHIEGGGSYRTYGWTDRRVYAQSWFSESILMPFEDSAIRVPAGYHELLSFLYGDYMQIPPADQQRVVHSFYYMDLHACKSIKQVESEIGVSPHEEEAIHLADVIDTFKNRKSLKILKRND